MQRRRKSKTVTRRAFMKASAAVGSMIAASGLPSPAVAQSATPFLFLIGTELGMEWVPEMNAVSGNHFRNEGLDVQIVAVRGSAVAIQQILAGRVGVAAAGSIDLFKVMASQQPVVSIGTISQGGIYTVASLKSAPVRSPADMRGKTVGVVSLGGGTENMLDLLLASANMKPVEVPRQPIGRSMGAVELVKQQRIHAFLSIPEIDVAMRRANEPLEGWNTDKYAPLPGQCYLASHDTVSKNPAIMQGFIRAVYASVKEILSADDNMILDRIEKDRRFEVAGSTDRSYRIEAKKAYDELILTHGPGNILRHLPEVWTNSAELMAKAGIVDVRSRIGTAYTNKFVDALR